jgi:hypothetical protein
MSDDFKTLDNPWNKAYWYARMLIGSDKYGNIGRDSKTFLALSAALRSVIEANRARSAEQLSLLLLSTLRNILVTRYARKKPTKRMRQVELLCDDLAERLLTPKDFEVFVLTCETLIVPINEALPAIPSSDREYAQAIAKSHLDTLGESGLPNIINLWDDLGLYGCLNAERVQVIRGFAGLRVILEQENLTDEEMNSLLTAYVQEFERRLGQKRKGRAGRGLEAVTSFILEHFGIAAAAAPEHFQADIEVDNWVKVRDGWLIRISCKRTLRERWKQVSSGDRRTMSRFKIKAIWHLLTYDNDLSDDKLASLGEQDHIFYLRDDSECYTRASQHQGLKTYVRPMSSFIRDLIAEK